MNSNERLGIVVFVVLLCTSLLYPILSPQRNFSSTSLAETSTLVEGELFIYQNEDWELYGWPGNGTMSSPYVVENMYLTQIAISSSNLFFEVRNCTCDDTVYIESTSNGKIENSSFFDRVLIYDSSNLTISNVTFDSVIEGQYSESSLLIQFSEKITIEDCIITGSRDTGISVKDSNNCTIQKNSFSFCGTIMYVTYMVATAAESPIGSSLSLAQSTDYTIGGGALHIDNGSMCIISNNTMYNNVGYGIQCSNSDNLEMTSNFEENSGLTSKFTNCRENGVFYNTFNSGLILDSCFSFTIVGNEFSGNGLCVTGKLSTLFHDVVDNSVHSKPLLFLVNESDIVYSDSDYGQIIIVNSSRVLLSRLTLGASFPSIDILYSISCNITETNCPSIRIDHSNNSVVYRNIVTEGATGIHFEYSLGCQIYKNTIRDTKYGVRIGYGSNGSIVYENTLIDVSRFGIWIFSPFCVVENNTLSGCAITGYGSGHWQIPIYYGAIKILSDDCVIHNNTVVNNHGYGIWITGNRNMIYRNTLYGNALGNGLSEGEDNQWDNGIDIGNYWGDWIGFGVYYIPGNEGCVDNYPMGIPFSITPVIMISLLASGAIAIVVLLNIVRRWKSRIQ